MNSAGPFTFWLSAHLYVCTRACACVFVCTARVPRVRICTSEFHFFMPQQGWTGGQRKRCTQYSLIHTPGAHAHTHMNARKPAATHKSQNLCYKKKYRWQLSVTVSDINSGVISGKLFKALWCHFFTHRWLFFFFRLNQIWSSRLNYTVKVGVLGGNGFGVLGICCVRWLKLPDPNLCPRMLWTPVFPHRILSDPPSQCRPDLLGPEVSLLLFPASASDTHSHTCRGSSSWRAEERKREMAPVISPLLTGTLQHSLSQGPRGDNIKQRKKTFQILLSFTTESSYLSSHPVFFFFYRLLTYSSYLSFPQSLWSGPCSVVYKVWHFDNTL